MTIKKEFKKFIKIFNKGSYNKIYTPPVDIDLVNIISNEDIVRNNVFIENMKKHRSLTNPKSFLVFLPYINPDNGFLAGGYRTIMLLNNALSKIFNAKIYLCFFPTVTNKNVVKEFTILAKKHFPDMIFEIVEYKDVYSLNVDVALCNFWMGAYPLLKFNNCKEKYNLIQDHEALFYNDAVYSLAEQTLSFGFYKICNSLALQNYTKFIDGSAKSFRYFPGIDHSLYYPADDKKNSDICKIIFYGRPSTPRNAFSFLIPVFKKVKAKLGNKVKIVSVGEDYNVKYYQLDGVVENYGKLASLEQLANLYRQFDIGVSLITTPTFSYQHLEFMASGLCLITNKQLGIEDFLEDGKNSVISELCVDVMANKIIDLANNAGEIKRISKNAVETTKKLDWNKCFQSIADFIISDKRVDN